MFNGIFLFILSKYVSVVLSKYVYMHIYVQISINTNKSIFNMRTAIEFERWRDKEKWPSVWATGAHLVDYYSFGTFERCILILYSLIYSKWIKFHFEFAHEVSRKAKFIAYRTFRSDSMRWRESTPCARMERNAILHGKNIKYSHIIAFVFR